MDFFPPRPRLRGRAIELATLRRALERTAPARLALVGAGGSGKSVLAAALGHALGARFGGRVHWFRVGAWDPRTILEMLALRFRTPRERARLVPGLRALFAREERLVFLDNHEDDRATASILDTFADTKASFVLTARRCLLAGVLVFPVTAPLVTEGRAAFPTVARLTRLFRWNPLALDIAEALVGTGVTTPEDLERELVARGLGRVRAVEHEDDVPEVGLLVAYAWERLPADSRRMLAVLAHVDGDHVDAASLAKLARVRGDVARALEPLRAQRLVQEHFEGRFALHAVVRHAIAKRTRFDPARLFSHYVGLLERDPARLPWEQTHLFGAMDYAHRIGDVDGMVRVERLLATLG
jgi:hypothetical protein